MTTNINKWYSSVDAFFSKQNGLAIFALFAACILSYHLTYDYKVIDDILWYQADGWSRDKISHGRWAGYLAGVIRDWHAGGWLSWLAVIPLVYYGAVNFCNRINLESKLYYFIVASFSISAYPMISLGRWDGSNLGVALVFFLTSVAFRYSSKRIIWPVIAVTLSIATGQNTVSLYATFFLILLMHFTQSSGWDFVLARRLILIALLSSGLYLFSVTVIYGFFDLSFTRGTGGSLSSLLDTFISKLIKSYTIFLQGNPIVKVSYFSVAISSLLYVLSKLSTASFNPRIIFNSILILLVASLLPFSFYLHQFLTPQEQWSGWAWHSAPSYGLLVLISLMFLNATRGKLRAISGLVLFFCTIAVALTANNVSYDNKIRNERALATVELLYTRLITDTRYHGQTIVWVGKGPFEEFWLAENHYFDKDIQKKTSDYHAVVANLAFNKYFFGLKTPTAQEVFNAYEISLKNELKPWPDQSSLYFNEEIAFIVLGDLQDGNFDWKKFKDLYEFGRSLEDAYFNQ